MRVVIPTAGRERASPRFIAIYAFAYACLWLALLTPAIVTLALRVRQLVPGNASETLSRVLLAGALVALVSNPIFGAWSDRTRSRFGRRRPWLVGGVLCGCVSLAAISLAPTINMVILSWCAAQLSFNAVIASMVAIIPDRIPPFQRGTVVGILGVCMPIGQVTGTFLVQRLSINMTLAFVVPGVIGVAGVLSLAFILPPESPPQRVPVQARPAVAAVNDYRDFSWTWLSRVLFTTGSCFLQAYQPFFLLEALHLNVADVPRLMFCSTLVQAAMVVVWSLISGRLSDRTGRRKPFAMAGSTIQGLGLWLIAFSHSFTMLLLGVALVGMGHGVYEGVDLALVTDVLPDRARHAAKDLGLLNIANTLPQVIAPLAAPAILQVSRGDYTLLFALAGSAAALGSILLRPLKNVR